MSREPEFGTSEVKVLGVALGARATLEERRAAFEICRQRGHQDSGRTLTSNPPWQVCRHCGTHYRYEERLVEQNTPESDSVIGNPQ